MNELNYARAATGIAGLDNILGGGFPREEMYLVRGGPGTGKTTLGLQFLLEGVKRGERTLYVTLSQTEEGLRKIAQSHGWTLDEISIQVLIPWENTESAAVKQTVLDTVDVELEGTIQALIQTIQEVDPDRVIFDSLGVVRLLAEKPYRYRLQIVRIKAALDKQKCTALFLDEGDTEEGYNEFERLAHGVLHLARMVPEYGDIQRSLWVVKMRGINVHGGEHNFRILTGGLEVYPRLQQIEATDFTDWEIMKSGIPELDKLSGGGLETGTTCLVVGTSGTGKSSIATHYAYTAAQEGKRSAIFLFDEGLDTYYARSAALGVDIRPHVEDGIIQTFRIDSRKFSSGEFAEIVREAIDEKKVKVVIVDSLTGYFHAMPQERYPGTQIYELLTYASRRRALTLVVEAWHGVGQGIVNAPMHVSYIADTVILVRQYEVKGEIRKAISVAKKRHGKHERFIREMRFTDRGIEIGNIVELFDNTPANNSIL